MGNTFSLKIFVNRDCELLCVRECFLFLFFFVFFLTYKHSFQMLHCHPVLKINIYMLFLGSEEIYPIEISL